MVLDSNLRIVCIAVAMTNTHDFKLFKESKLPVKKKTIFCVDTGYLGLSKLHTNTEMPKKKRKLNPLSKEDKIENKNKSSKRIPIEHINILYSIGTFEWL
ncbi:transposase family protein [Sulfurimonas sp. NW9]|uniref:transposase family protein n=1 Tax=Sulfurimonas sp. NW9 TaxID=2922728 RepID=UPI003DA9B446